MFQVVMANVENIEIDETSDSPRQALDFVLTQAEHRQLLQVPDLFADIPDAIESQVESRQVAKLIYAVGYIFACKKLFNWWKCVI